MDFFEVSERSPYLVYAPVIIVFVVARGLRILARIRRKYLSARSKSASVQRPKKPAFRVTATVP